MGMGWKRCLTSFFCGKIGEDLMLKPQVWLRLLIYIYIHIYLYITIMYIYIY